MNQDCGLTKDLLIKNKKIKKKKGLSKAEIGENQNKLKNHTDSDYKVVYDNDHCLVEIKTETAEIEANKSKVDIIAWNVNGLRAISKKADLKDLVTEQDPDILCFYELKCEKKKYIKDKTWKSMKYLDKFSYRYYSFSQIPGYSGVSVFSKIKPISYTFSFNNAAVDKESRFICLEFEKFYLVSVYVPCVGEGLKRIDFRDKQWDASLRNYCIELRKKKPVIIAGDMNVAHKDIDAYYVVVI